MSKPWTCGAGLAVALAFVPVMVGAQIYGGQRPTPLPNAAPQIPSGPQPFQANPYLGMPDEPSSPLPPTTIQDGRPPAASYDIIDMDTGQMHLCQRNGKVIACQ